jgi:hypothetical protein
MTSIWIELARAVVDLVKAVAWPTAVVILALKFKPELLTALPSLFRRKFELEALGVRAMIDAAAEQQVAPENPAIEKLLETTLLEPSPHLAVNIVENFIRESLKSVERTKWEATLSRALAEARLRQAHEFNYNRIFGSQIAYLKRLNEVSRTTKDQAREFFTSYAEKYPEFYANYSFEKWLIFMIAGGLIAEKDGGIELSVFGHDFLVYIVEQRLLENKPG